MKLEEVLPNLRDGEKVTRTCWPKGCYLVLKEGLLYDEDGYREEICTDSIFVDDWELYEDKYKKELNPIEKLKATAFAEMEEQIYCMDSEYDDRLKVLEDHKNRQIDENRKSFKRMEDLQERIRLLEKK